MVCVLPVATGKPVVGLTTGATSAVCTVCTDVAMHTGYQELAAGEPNASEVPDSALITGGVPVTTITGAYSSNIHTLPFNTHSPNLQIQYYILLINSTSKTFRSTIRCKCGQYIYQQQPSILQRLLSV